MTRDEVVVFWRSVLVRDGSRGLADALFDLYVTQRCHELHDPEWVACLECGCEFELPWNGKARAVALQTVSEFCRLCTARHRRDCDRLKSEWPGLVREAQAA